MWWYVSADIISHALSTYRFFFTYRILHTPDLPIVRSRSISCPKPTISIQTYNPFNQRRSRYLFGGKLGPDDELTNGVIMSLTALSHACEFSGGNARWRPAERLVLVLIFLKGKVPELKGPAHLLRSTNPDGSLDFSISWSRARVAWSIQPYYTFFLSIQLQQTFRLPCCLQFQRNPGTENAPRGGWDQIGGDPE